jgi:hypothetical protein
MLNAESPARRQIGERQRLILLVWTDRLQQAGRSAVHAVGASSALMSSTLMNTASGASAMVVISDIDRHIAIGKSLREVLKLDHGTQIAAARRMSLVGRIISASPDDTCKSAQTVDRRR